MKGGLLLDTHIWLALQSGHHQDFSSSLISSLEALQKQGQLWVSAISILEVARLISLEQFDLGVSVDDFVTEAFRDGGLELAEMSPRILIESTRLPGDMHRDPADRILAATARELGLTLITRDKALLAYAKRGHLNARKP